MAKGKDKEIEFRRSSSRWHINNSRSNEHLLNTYHNLLKTCLLEDDGNDISADNATMTLVAEVR